MPNTAVSVTTSATVLIAARLTEPGRIGLVLDNQSAQTVFVGDAATVTTSTGITLPSGDKLIFTPEMSFIKYFFRSGLWGIVASGTADVRVWELQYE